ncbi:MAG: O-succinylbenzoic acid--CoA ligase [Myxococcota bacterium]|jgi:O-succinylbenzoic acid--CoA ligase
MICPLTHAADRFGEAAALIDGPTVLSFAELSARVAGCTLLDDLPPGTRIGIWDPDHLAAIPVMLAAWRRGIAVALMSSRLPEVSGIAARLGLVRILRGGDLRLPEPAPTRPATVTDGIATILLTSGSSGQPKAVAHPFSAHLANATGSNTNIPFAPGHRWRRSLSMSHIGGLAMLFRALTGGGALVLDATTPVTHLSLVAVQLRRLLSQATLPDLSALLIGGGPIPPDLIIQALHRGLPVHTTYGMTELGSQVTTTPPGATAQQLTTAGRPLPGREVAIADTGEILIRGETLLSGYLTDDGLTAGVDAGGWYHTGDVGRLVDGWLTPTGRLDQMFISGGENIHPETIERVLGGLVEASVVVAVPDAEWGARPVAIIAGDFDADTLRAALSGRLPRFAVPDAFLPWPPDAPGTTAKPPRAWLRAWAAGRIS